MAGSYWTNKTISRRAALRGAAATGGGLAALSLVGCGGGTSKPSNVTPPSSSPAALDSTKGKRGGTIRIQGPGYPGTLKLVTAYNTGVGNLAGYTHSGLLMLKGGRPIAPGNSIEAEPDLAAAMPEQPADQISYVFKLRPAKFHNGKAVTSEDVKYSLERYASGNDSAHKSRFTWLERVDTPDPQTAIVKTKGPYADTTRSLTARYDPFIMSKEWEETAESTSKLMGSGPFLFVEDTPPVITRFKRNPDYFLQPYPYFDEVQVIGNTDTSKKIADFSSKQITMSYWHNEEERDQIKRNRPDALFWAYNHHSFNVYPRVDIPPYNDQRVRQALNMTIDRKAIRDAVSKGTGEDDQVFGVAGHDAWGFRKPSELGDAAKYWKFDPATAKQLLSAAGFTKPIESDFGHWDGTVIPGILDSATLLASKWRELGVANLKDITQSFAQRSTTGGVGNFEGLDFGPAAFAVEPTIGISLRSQMWSPPEGVKSPTTNAPHMNDAQMNALLDKQMGQLNLDERKQTFHALEDIMAVQHYRLALSSYTLNWFLDPSVKNGQILNTSYNGATSYIKYWWFE